MMEIGHGRVFRDGESQMQSQRLLVIGAVRIRRERSPDRAINLLLFGGIIVCKA
jgi:hypothetical protein